MEFCGKERERNGGFCDLDSRGEVMGYERVLSDGREVVLRCCGHVSGFSTSVWVMGDVAFAVFVNLDGGRERERGMRWRRWCWTCLVG